MSLLGSTRLHYVDSVETAGDFLAWLGQRRPVLAIDTETTGLEWWTDHFTRLVQFGDAEQGWAVSALRWRGVIETALAGLGDTPTVFHNAKFDLHALEGDGYPTPARRKAHDTLVMHHLLDPSAGHSLKGILTDRYGPEAGVGQRMLRAHMTETRTSWADVDETAPAYWGYAAFDTCLTARLAEELWPQVHTEGLTAAYEREMAAMWVLHDAETRGLRVDPTYAEMLRNQWLIEAAGLKDDLEAAGIRNPSSNRQITAVLEESGWEPGEYTPSGAVKLDKAILSQLQATFPGDIAEKVLRFRRLLKWNASYLTAFIDQRDGTDHIHSSIRTLGARTGRMSISNPPLQQLPRGPEIRRAVLPEDGHDLWCIDFDAQELRLFAHYSQEAKLIEAFTSGQDLHRYVAGMVYGCPPDVVTKEQRQITKGVTYGRLYGAGPTTLAATSGTTEAEVRHFLSAYDAAFPQVSAFVRDVERTGKERWADDGRPYIRTWGGRPIHTDGEHIYALLNYLLQGTAADIIKTKLIDIEAAGLGQYLVLPVHDELILSVPSEWGHDIAHEVGKLLEAHEFTVPLTTNVTGPFSNWGAHYE